MRVKPTAWKILNELFPAEPTAADFSKAPLGDCPRGRAISGRHAGLPNLASRIHQGTGVRITASWHLTHPGHLDGSALDIYPPEEEDDDSKYATW